MATLQDDLRLYDGYPPAPMASGPLGSRDDFAEWVGDVTAQLARRDGHPTVDDLRLYDGYPPAPVAWYDRPLRLRVAIPILAAWCVAAYFLVRLAVGLLS